MIADYQGLYPGANGVDAAAVQGALDARPRSWWTCARIESAPCPPSPAAIGQDEFERAAPRSSPGSEVITYCTIGHRSAAYAQKLAEYGLSARNFDGSLRPGRGPAASSSTRRASRRSVCTSTAPAGPGGGRLRGLSGSCPHDAGTSPTLGHWRRLAPGPPAGCRPGTPASDRASRPVDDEDGRPPGPRTL